MKKILGMNKMIVIVLAMAIVLSAIIGLTVMAVADGVDSEHGAVTDSETKPPFVEVEHKTEQNTDHQVGIKTNK